jgi:hypothetical protein
MVLIITWLSRARRFLQPLLGDIHSIDRKALLGQVNGVSSLTRRNIEGMPYGEAIDVIFEESGGFCPENIGSATVNRVPLAAIILRVIPRDQLPGRGPTGLGFVGSARPRDRNTLTAGGSKKRQSKRQNER